MQEAYYIGYKDKSIGFAPLVAAAAATGPVGLTIGGAIAAASAIIAAAPALSTWITGWWSRPAANARGLISAAKPQLLVDDPLNRIAYVIAISQKIQGGAKDVDAAEWLLWYRQNYPNDYLTLDQNTKTYWNTYLNSIKAAHGDGNNMYANLSAAMFTTDQINYTPTPINTLSNVLSTATSSLSNTTLSSNWVIYAGAALVLYLITKK